MQLVNGMINKEWNMKNYYRLYQYEHKIKLNISSYDMLRLKSKTISIVALSFYQHLKTKIAITTIGKNRFEIQNCLMIGYLHPVIRFLNIKALSVLLNI